MVTHQDAGQIDMYVRMYDDLKCKDGDNPTIGILLCSETNEDIARYSVLNDNNRLFMSKHLTVTPDKTNSTFLSKKFFGVQTKFFSENRH